jgi:hypothetical protein
MITTITIFTKMQTYLPEFSPGYPSILIFQGQYFKQQLKICIFEA